MNVRLAAFGVLLIAGAVLPGCSCGEPPVQTESDASTLVECVIDEECGLGESCVNGQCQRFADGGGADASMCVEDTDCPSPLVCLKSSGICVEDTGFDAGMEDGGQAECVDGDTRPCGEIKIGECQLGVQTCANGAFGSCEGAVLPTSESCDGRDNDCDGTVDEDYDKLNDPVNCGSCGRVCSFPFATALCVNGDCAMGACEPSHHDLNGDPTDGCEYACATTNGGTEACDGIDNDCDGAVDEGGAPITCGTGACVNTVAWCTNGTPGVCSPKPGSAEVCDGVDNDCDGAVDDNLGNATCGQGVCFKSIPSCVNGATQTCVPNPGSVVEQCDGVDDDCDGQVDEGCTCLNGATQPCYSGSTGTAGIGECKAGTQTCVSGAWSACAGEVKDSPEVCDNKDNDCDGVKDEGLGTTTCGSGECLNTVNNCVNGVAQTCSPKPAIAESCDNKDNDCDGLVDENLGSTTCGTGACQVTVQNCVAGTANTCMPGTGTTEVCDNVDNDCDGATDESFPGQGGACSTGLAGPCATGASACTNGAVTCSQTVTAQPTDTCGNGIDDNCNGTVDDPSACGCNSAIDNDTDGSNECLDCNDQDGTIRPGAMEKCNGKDDDCDGARDEGFDADGDGYTTCGTKPAGGIDPTRIDCNDNNAFVFPGKATDCGNASTPNTPNAIDDNCNGYADETCGCSTADSDGDGVSECQGDCADNDPQVFPGKTEICDGKDNDCNKSTVQNCGVSDPCGAKKMGTFQPFPTGTDVCKADLICVTNLSTGALQCASFCNQTTGSGLNDSCASDEGCYFNLIDSDNLHLCGKLTVGVKTTGQSCSLDSECRSGDCHPGLYCTDKCTHEAGCSSTTTCFAEKVTTAPPNPTSYYYSYCRLDSTISGTKTLGQTCTGTDCKAGTGACFNGKCTEPCCQHSDCPTGYTCSINGPSVDTGYNAPTGEDIYSILPSCLASSANKVSGQACTASTDCKSGICDKNLNICVDTCCNDSSCANGTTCEPVSYKNSAGKRSFIRACVFSPVPSLIEQK